MTTQIDVTGPVGADVRGVMGGLLKGAAARLAAGGGDIHEAVHDARKDLKAFRSYLRLLREIVGADYESLNLTARDAARALSGARDSRALHDAIGQIDKHAARRRHGLALDRLREAADAELADAASEAAIRAAARDVARLLAPARDVVDGWSLPDEPAPYVAGLGATYRGARRALRAGLHTCLPADLHEARKRVIHWRYQLDMFAGLWPRVLRAQVRELQDLREDLGQHNDLVLLEGRIKGAEGGFAGLGNVEPVLDAITVLRARRVRAARYREALLFSQPSRAVTRRLAIWWEAARAQKAAP